MTDLSQATKQCRVCGVTKPLDEYYKMRGARDGHRNDCKVCNVAAKQARYRANPTPAIERAKQWRLDNPARYRQRMDAYRESGKKAVADRKSHLKRKYGLSIENFERMLAEQGGGCAICGLAGVDHVDHSHATGAVRGILCFRCNAAIGQLDDDPERARALADYLERDAELDAMARARSRALATT